MKDEKPKPLRVMDAKHRSNIFSLAFSLDDRFAFSGGNDNHFYTHDIETGAKYFEFSARGSIHRVDSHPTASNIVAVASEDRQLYLVDIREKDYTSVYAMGSPLYSVKYNPLIPELICVSMERNGCHVYDMRKMKEPYAVLKNSNNATHCTWSPNGQKIAAVISGGCLSLYDSLYSTHVTFNDPEFQNQITMKSCLFMDDDTLLCGSDQWDIFAWKVPSDNEVRHVSDSYSILRGHRSIVNHIRYSSRNSLIVSSGVEKIVKCWSPFEMPDCARDPVRREIINSIPDSLMYNYAGHDDDTEEDLHTLHQFDYYLERANRDASMVQTLHSEHFGFLETIHFLDLNWEELSSLDSQDSSEDDPEEHEEMLLDEQATSDEETVEP
ncbi:hypothetical protein M3Y98_00135500 [Aphelenchoides besseyi]|nr:hypothetical protein M3Y98_00135500 [Aphelenchoides besseyi]KAI6199653.1 hypothetical protein M3Y96_00649700 [Aphelenchoides besseyi]